MNLSTNNKRFLIIWVIFHSFALFVNIAHIQGTIREDSFTINEKFEYLFTDLSDNEKFWPFVTYYEEIVKPVSYNPQPLHIVYFHGVFNSYGFAEYIFYMLVGIGIVFIPKIWK